MFAFVLLSFLVGYLTSITFLSHVISGYNCSRLNESVVAPVRYLLGSNDGVMSRIPPSIASQVTPGYVHFRAFSPSGVPNAFCPGVK